VPAASPFPEAPFRTLAGGIALWLTGMVFGVLAFSIPQGRDATPIPYISANPFISVPILIAWPLLARALARRLVKRAGNPRVEGLRVGVVFLAVNALLDRVVVVGLMDAGPGFYSYLALWLAYSLLVIVPWRVGRATHR
jgi:hypothetical protein